MKFIDYPRLYLCEFCGRSSQSHERCTHCGHELENPPEVEPPRWGRITIRLKRPEDAEAAWRRLAGYWSQWEERDDLGLIPSQMDQFLERSGTVELYGSDLEFRAARQLLRNEALVEFEELPGEQVPRRSPSSASARLSTEPGDDA